MWTGLGQNEYIITWLDFFANLANLMKLVHEVSSG